MSVLQNILENKRAEVEQSRVKISLDVLKQKALATEQPRAFRKALLSKGISVIAEIKKASPSRGVLTQDFQPAALAQEFERNGAAALSVLTDKKFFQGEPSYLEAVKSVVQLPVLRKDFIIDEYQVYESRALGADAILLIVSALTQDKLSALYDLARSIDLGVLVEVHSEEEVQRANAIKADVIGVNNRDLATFEVSLTNSLRLKPLIHSSAVTVSESGISTNTHLSKLHTVGFDAVLVGEGLMTSQDRGNALRELMQT